MGEKLVKSLRRWLDVILKDKMHIQRIMWEVGKGSEDLKRSALSHKLTVCGSAFSDLLCKHSVFGGVLFATIMFVALFSL